MSAIALVRQEKNRVYLIMNGRLVADMPWQAADQVREALRIKARAAEEYEKAHQIIDDGAFLLRAGIRIGLTDNPKMKAEIANEAVSNRTLRRQINPLKGVPSQEVPGLPSVYRQTDLDAMSLKEKARVLGQTYPNLHIKGKPT